MNSHPVSRLREAKGLSREEARSFAALRMTRLNLSVGEELSSACEPCLSKDDLRVAKRKDDLRVAKRKDEHS